MLLILLMLLVGTSSLQSACMGNNFIHVLTNAGEVRSFGNNEMGSLGVGKNISFQGREVPPNTLSNVTSIYCGWKHACFLLTNASLFCTGNNQYHQVSESNETIIYTPTWVADGIERAGLGGGHTCVVKRDFSLNNTARTSYIPVRKERNTGNIDLYCWGRGTEGQLGTGNNISLSSIPAIPIALFNLTEFSLGGFHTTVTNALGKTKVFGSNLFGQASLGVTTPPYDTIFTIPPPDAITYGSYPVKISAGFTHNSWLFPLVPNKVLRVDKTSRVPGRELGVETPDSFRNQEKQILSSSGLGLYNALGYGNTLNYGSLPLLTPPPAHYLLVDDMESYDSMTCILVNGVVGCWGQNFYHEINPLPYPYLNTTPYWVVLNDASNPKLIPGGSGSGQMCVLANSSYTSSISLYCQGDNVNASEMVMMPTNCGNGIVEPSEGEECENTTDNKVLCNAYCLVVPPATFPCLPLNLSVNLIKINKKIQGDEVEQEVNRDWFCDSGTWVGQGNYFVNGSLVLESPLNITGDLVLGENATLAMNSNSQIRVSTFLTLGGKLNLTQVAFLPYPLFYANKINGSFSEISLNVPGCTKGKVIVNWEITEMVGVVILDPACGRMEEVVILAGVLAGVGLIFLLFLGFSLVMCYRKYRRRQMYRHIDSV